MRNHVRVVVIGGGVVGASVLYHLTKAGWKDVLLIERAELTSGSTWHAAGGMHTVNGDPNVAKLQQYTINLYQELEQISGQSCGMHITGGILLAGTRERMDWLRMTQARGRYLGMELELISTDEAARLFQRYLIFELGFHRLELACYGFNERAIRHSERVGYVCEGVKRRAYLRHGEWQDAVQYALLREDLE